MRVEKALNVIAHICPRATEQRMEKTIAIDREESLGHWRDKRFWRCGDGFKHLFRLLTSEGLAKLE